MLGRLNLLGRGPEQSKLWLMWEIHTHVNNNKKASGSTSHQFCVLNQVIYHL